MALSVENSFSDDELLNKYFNKFMKEDYPADYSKTLSIFQKKELNPKTCSFGKDRYMRQMLRTYGMDERGIVEKTKEIAFFLFNVAKELPLINEKGQIQKNPLKRIKPKIIVIENDPSKKDYLKEVENAICVYDIIAINIDLIELILVYCHKSARKGRKTSYEHIIASLIAHEIGHMIGGDHFDRIKSILQSKMLKEDSIASGGRSQKKMEYRADRLGLEILKKTNIPQKSMIEMLKVFCLLVESEVSDPLDSHPTPKERMKAINLMIASNQKYSFWHYLSNLTGIDREKIKIRCRL